MSTQTTKHSVMSAEGRRRTVLKDSSWIRRSPEEDEPVEHDPNFGRVVLAQVKAADDEPDRKPEEGDPSPGDSGTSVISLTKRFSSGQESFDRSSRSVPPVPPVSSKPAVPVKSPALQASSSSSSFTARVFSANSSSRALSPVKPSFGEKFPEVTASQTTNGLERSSGGGSTPPAAVTISSSSSSSSSSTSTAVRTASPVSRSERVSVSSSSPASTAATTPALDETAASSPEERARASLRMSDVSVSSTLTSRQSSQSDSSPLDARTLTLLSSVSAQSPPVRSQTQEKISVQQQKSSSAQQDSLVSTPVLQVSSRPLSSRDVCTVCGKPIAGGERMILEELKINSHTSCFRCAVCQCDLGGLEAGKSLWVHRERINCSNCFSKIRGQWYI